MMDQLRPSGKTSAITKIHATDIYDFMSTIVNDHIVPKKKVERGDVGIVCNYCSFLCRI